MDVKDTTNGKQSLVSLDNIPVKYEEEDGFIVDREIKEETMDNSVSNQLPNEIEDAECFLVDGTIKEEPIDELCSTPLDILPLKYEEEDGFYMKKTTGDSLLPSEESTGGADPTTMGEDEETESLLGSNKSPHELGYAERMKIIRDVISEVTAKCRTCDAETINDAVFAVCMGESKTNEAARQINLSSPGLNCYVQKARKKLGNILPPRVIRECIIAVTQSRFYEGCILNNGGHNDRLNNALFAIILGKSTTQEAADEFDLPYSTLSTYLVKVRQGLDNTTLPPPKSTETPIPLTGKREETITQNNGDEMLIIEEDASVTIDGVTVPKSISLLNDWLEIGRLDFSHAQPFLGKREGLRRKLINILQSLNFGGVVMKLADAIMNVYVDGYSIPKACRINKFNQKTLTEYSNAVKIFIDFDNSLCAWKYRARHQSQGITAETGKKAPEPLPKPPMEKLTKDKEIKKEEIDYEYEPIIEQMVEPPVKKIKEE